MALGPQVSVRPCQGGSYAWREALVQTVGPGLLLGMSVVPSPRPASGSLDCPNPTYAQCLVSCQNGGGVAGCGEETPDPSV